MALTSETRLIGGCRSLSVQMKQVALTYITQRYLWLGLALYGVMVLPMTIMSITEGRRGSPDAAMPIMFIVGMPLLSAAPFLVGHAKIQLAHSRARLTPCILPAHLTVLAIILLMLLVVYPWFVAFAVGFRPMGILALAAAIGVPSLWGAHMTRFVPMLISLTAFYSMMTPWGIDWWMVHATEHAAIHAAIFVTGIVLSVAWIWRMSDLREEMDDYQNIYQAVLARRTGSEAVEQRRIVATQMRRSRFMGQLGDWWHKRLGGYYGGSRARLLRLLKYGFGVVPTEAQGLFFVAMILCIGIFFTQFSIFPSSGGGFDITFFFVQFGIIMPGMIAGETLAYHRARVATELLLPMSRHQLIDGLFAVLIRNSITFWLMIHVTLGIVIAMADRPLVPRTIVMFLLLSAASTLAAIGISLRVSVWPSQAKRIFVSMLAWMIILPPLFTWMATKGEFSIAIFAPITVGMAFIGVWAIRSARQTWLNLEFV